MSLTISRYSDDYFHGSLIMFVNMADNSIMGGMQSTSAQFKYKAK